jgi:hypothetical protein
MNENWRPIPGRAGYEVSDLGRVRSIDRLVMKLACDGPAPHRLKGRVLKPGPTSRGYLTVGLPGGTALVHRLVLTAFSGECPDGFEAGHRNGDKTDNRLANLL